MYVSFLGIGTVKVEGQIEMLVTCDIIEKCIEIYENSDVWRSFCWSHTLLLRKKDISVIDWLLVGKAFVQACV